MKEKWRQLVARERNEEFYKPNKSSVICSNHFLEADLYITTKGFRRLKKTAVPHLEFADDHGLSHHRKISQEENESFEQLTPAQYDFELTAATSEPRSSPIREVISPAHKSRVSSQEGLDSGFDTPRTSHLRKELRKCYQKLRFKDKQVMNLKKQNERLIKENLFLKKSMILLAMV
ncbi:unnamed protein product [Leptidea sinapis]|uniref:THAP-type domain-containing protein n=1 Tax=Leptidea sinapis TaxID=189913 RepID=A0A5E4Q5E3_9NEOP|nr:unnamed protein product [Leptidea sinapis]